jgi:hypothetical protein
MWNDECKMMNDEQWYEYAFKETHTVRLRWESGSQRDSSMDKVHQRITSLGAVFPVHHSAFIIHHSPFIIRP